MSVKDQIGYIENIALDDQELERQISKVSNEELIIDGRETLGIPFQRIPSSVRAIIVRVNSDVGLVRVYCRTTRFVATSPDYGAGFAFMIVQVGEGCIVHGQPSMRFLYQRYPVICGMEQV
ncbi:hypothetical protein M3J09_004704 [Ascochyta lentis]